jgi:hypothetical protein
LKLFERIVNEYGLSLYNPNVAIYAINMNEALNATRLVKYIYQQPIFLDIRKVGNQIAFTLKNRTGREIVCIFHEDEYESLKQSTEYSIQQIKEYRRKLKLENIKKDFE